MNRIWRCTAARTDWISIARWRSVRHLASGGLLFAECGWKQGEQAAQLFRQAGWKNVHLREDLAGIPRIICAEKL